MALLHLLGRVVALDMADKGLVKPTGANLLRLENNPLAELGRDLMVADKLGEGDVESFLTVGYKMPWL